MVTLFPITIASRLRHSLNTPSAITILSGILTDLRSVKEKAYLPIFASFVNAGSSVTAVSKKAYSPISVKVPNLTFSTAVDEASP